MVPDLCSEAGLSSRKTNHSLRVSGATRLFEAGVPEKVIQQRTSRRSLEALRMYMYERVTEQQELAVSKFSVVRKISMKTQKVPIPVTQAVVLVRCYLEFSTIIVP